LQKVKILEEGGKRWVEGLFTCSQEDHLQEEEEGGGIQNYEEDFQIWPVLVAVTQMNPSK
jgi:hypothetical protein